MELNKWSVSVYSSPFPLHPNMLTMMSLPVKHASMKQNDTSGDFCRFSVKQIWTHLKLQFILKRRFCYVCVCVCVCALMAIWKASGSIMFKRRQAFLQLICHGLLMKMMWIANEHCCQKWSDQLLYWFSQYLRFILWTGNCANKWPDLVFKVWKWRSGFFFLLGVLFRKAFKSAFCFF